MSPGDIDLSKIARNPTLDAVVLEFDFKTEYDSISFEYFFGSEEYPEYVWNKNVGYPTKAHREAIRKLGSTSHHRKSFKLLPDQLVLELID